MSLEKKYVIITLLIFLGAVVDAVGSLLGFWSDSGVEGSVTLAVKGLVLLGLILLSLSIKNWVYQTTPNSTYRKVAWLSSLSLMLCVGGDIINTNFPHTFYRYEGVVKHDYLAESIFFFGPGYLLLLVNGVVVAIDSGMRSQVIYVSILVGVLLGGASLLLMHLPDTGVFVTAMTGSYAALIGAIGTFSFVMIHALGGLRSSFGSWLVGLGFILACVADAVIGNFWIYGNGGEGYYPAVRYINWILYIGSQCLVIQLPYVLVSRHIHLTMQRT